MACFFIPGNNLLTALDGARNGARVHQNDRPLRQTTDAGLSEKQRERQIEAGKARARRAVRDQFGVFVSDREYDEWRSEPGRAGGLECSALLDRDELGRWLPRRKLK
jgi:hypothetical protein